LPFGPAISLCNVTLSALVLFLILLFSILLKAQAGGHTLLETSGSTRTSPIV
jgi:hypothetical protein